MTTTALHPEHLTISVPGLDCGDAPAVERRIRALPGVLDAYVNPLTRVAYVDGSPGMLTADAVLAAIRGEPPPARDAARLRLKLRDRVLLATNGSPGSAGAVIVAKRLAGPDTEVRVVTAVEPISVYASRLPSAATLLNPELDRRRTAWAASAVTAQLKAFAAESLGSLTTLLGDPAPTIAASAEEWPASLLVMGLGSHGPLDRWLGGETAIRVAHLTRTPLLAVPAAAQGLPERAVVAIDFSAQSRAALETAHELVGPGGELHLVHVVPNPALHAAQTQAAAGPLAAEAGSALTAWVPEGRYTTVQTRIGDPAREILQLADSIDADLIVAGSHGRGVLGRLLLGSVSTRLLRGARCSVLVVPAETGA